ncbi:MAG: hypothetical protein P8X42_19725, partial [Calditrichaceae bacterium]
PCFCSFLFIQHRLPLGSIKAGLPPSIKAPVKKLPDKKHRTSRAGLSGQRTGKYVLRSLHNAVLCNPANRYTSALHKGINACPVENPAFDGPPTNKLALWSIAQS